MTKNEFLECLKKEISGLPLDDAEQCLSFYAEMIEDRMADGLSEEEAVNQIGMPEEIALQIIQDTPLTKLVKEKIKPSRTLRVWEIVLLAIGSPIWLSLLVAIAAVVIAVAAVVLSCVIALWAVDLALALAALGGLVIGVIRIFSGNGLSGAAFIGAAITCAGLSILLFTVCVAATKGLIVIRHDKKDTNILKKLMTRKEAER